MIENILKRLLGKQKKALMKRLPTSKSCKQFVPTYPQIAASLNTLYKLKPKRFITTCQNIIKNDFFSTEITFLQLISYLRGRRFDLAEKKMMELKKFDDEDILSYLGQIYSHFYSGSTTQAVSIINEAKERFGDSAKLMNLMVNCLINQNKFEEAFDLATKLQQALLEKEQFSDRVEIETCFSNLVVLAEICGKPQVRDDCLNALQTINPAAYILKQQAALINQIEEEMKQ